MPEYQLQIKQIVDYPRCRIYRQFIQSLISDRNIRTNGGSGLFYYTVLSSYANFRTSYRRLGSINYTIYPGEWLCRIKELMIWFRTRLPRQAISILKDLQNRHLISYEILGNGSLVKYRIVGWHKNNRILEYNAPCQKDTGFFFLPTYIASEIIGTRRPSEMDIILDLWLNTVYNDEHVQGSEIAPVVYMRNDSNSPLVSYTELAQRYNMSKATVSRYLKKFKELELIDIKSFPGTHGSIISIKNYLSTMFQISDVILNKQEIATALNITIDIPDSVADKASTVSEPNTAAIMRKVIKVLVSQGFSCFECQCFRYKLLKLSDCKGTEILNSLIYRPPIYLLIIYCKETLVAKFELTLYSVNQKEKENEHKKRN